MNAPFERTAAAAQSLCSQYREVRETTLRLSAPLTDEDACAQSMPDASPAKWHLAHTTWFFETFILEAYEAAFKPFDPAFRVLFNSYYNGVGKQHPRPQRGLLTRPSLTEVRNYRHDVDERMAQLLEERENDPRVRGLLVLGINHEQQHQELLLTDVKHLLSFNPLAPALYEPLHHADTGPETPLEWRAFAGGVAVIGHSGEGFGFDNEGPRHRVHLEPFQLANRLVTNGEFAAFIDDGGYRNPALWLSEGWEWLRAGGIDRPLYWTRTQDTAPGWEEFTLRGLRPVERNLPAVHLSYFEADAYARWSGARLPTEAEWEHAAGGAAIEGNFLEGSRYHPADARPGALSQMFGDAWEWTQSSYAPYPGYRPAEGAIGEYNGKFMVNQYVLRGGSCATPQSHIRASYRNFFPTGARWQFSGIRLARDD